MSEPSRQKFLAIQVVSVIVYLGAFAGPVAYRGFTGDEIPLGLFLGGAAVMLGAMFLASGAPRIYDPSRSITVDNVERSVGTHDGEQVEVRHVTGQSEVSYSRTTAIRATVTGVMLGAVGLGLGLYL